MSDRRFTSLLLEPRRGLAAAASTLALVIAVCAPRLGRAQAAPQASSALASPSQPDASARPLTLEEALAIALRQQPSLAAAQADRSSAVASVEAIDVEARPTVTASASYDAGARQPDSLAEPTQQASAGLGASWRLWDFGQRRTRREAARASVDAASQRLSQSERAVLEQVELSWQRVLGAEAALEVRRSAVAAERRHLADTERLLGAGTRTAIDLAQARSRLASARLAQTQAEAQRRVAVAALEQAIGASLPEPIAFAAGWPAPLAGEDASVATLLGEAQAADPELAALAAQEQSAALSRRAVAWSGRPVLAGSVSAGVDALGSYGVPPSDRDAVARWSVGLSLTWQLYDGGARRAQLHAAQAQQQRAAASTSTRRLELTYRVRSARLDVAAAKAQLVASAESVTAASEQLRLAEARLQAGLGTSAELADAQDAVTQALGASTQATVDLALARVTLRSLLGRPRS